MAPCKRLWQLCVFGGVPLQTQGFEDAPVSSACATWCDEVPLDGQYVVPECHDCNNIVVGARTECEEKLIVRDCGNCNSDSVIIFL